jgi:hypothetical protein
MSGLEALRLSGYAAAGFMLGLASFASLKTNATLYLSGGLWRPVALHLARLAALGAVLTLFATQGAGALLAGAAGLLVARHLVVRRVRTAL